MFSKSFYIFAIFCYVSFAEEHFQLKKHDTNLYLSNNDMEFHCLREECFQQYWYKSRAVNVVGPQKLNFVYFGTQNKTHLWEILPDSCNGTEITLYDMNDDKNKPNWYSRYKNKWFLFLENGTVLALCTEDYSFRRVYVEKRKLKVGPFSKEVSGKQLIDVLQSDDGLGP